MLGWLRRQPPLTGAPVVRRMKTYSAASGYVYQYFYEGHRPAGGAEPGTEFVFQVTGDRRAYASVTVLLSDAVLEGAPGLNSTERYAVAKLALLQAFDERPGPAGMREPVRLQPADLAAIMEQLGFV